MTRRLKIRSKRCLGFGRDWDGRLCAYCRPCTLLYPLGLLWRKAIRNRERQICPLVSSSVQIATDPFQRGIQKERFHELGGARFLMSDQ